LKTLFLLFFVLSIIGGQASAENLHDAADFSDRNVRFIYVADDLYRFYVTLERVTEIRLQPGEEFIAMYGGATDGVMAEHTATANDNGARQVSVFIKPTKKDIATNIIAITDRRMYRLHITYDDEYYNPLISWQYPLDEYFASQRALARLEEEFGIIPTVGTETVNIFRYELVVKGDKRINWKPVYAFEYRGKIYIRMPESVKLDNMPVLFAVEEGKPQLVNYRLRQNHYIVDRINSALLLVSGDEQVLIRRKEKMPAPAEPEKKKKPRKTKRQKKEEKADG
jgi:type IV secretion system protein VirB9